MRQTFLKVMGVIILICVLVIIFFVKQGISEGELQHPGSGFLLASGVLGITVGTFFGLFFIFWYKPKK